MRRLIFCMAVIAVISCSSKGNADIYRFEDEDGVISFSDNPPDKRYLLVMKEQQSRSAKNVRGKYLPAANRVEESPSRRLEQESDLARTLPIQGIITSSTGLRTDPLDGKLKHHNGIDIAAPSGTPVKPVASGTVIFSGWKSGYGNTVILEHNDGMVTVYGHHSRNNVNTGEAVDTNSVIAMTGSTGRSTGPHLHFEAWQGGVNISNDFISGSSPAQNSTSLANPQIRRLLQEDGTILFTNLR